MPLLPVIQLAKPIKSVTIARSSSGNARVGEIVSAPVPIAANQAASDAVVSVQELEAFAALYHNASAVLQDAAAKLNQLCEEIIAGHHEAIARLSVEIARKVIMRNIEEGDYEIESIIKEALRNAPKNTDIVVRLNPRDLANFQQLRSSGETDLSGFELEADPGVGQAECVVESSKGIIKVLIDEHLEQISKALAKTG